MTTFHSLVDRMGPDCGHPTGVAILSNAVESGADFAMDDPDPGETGLEKRDPLALKKD